MTYHVKCIQLLSWNSSKYNTLDLIFFFLWHCHKLTYSDQFETSAFKKLNPTRKIYLYNIALSLQLWQDVIKSEIINTFIGVFIVRDKFPVLGQLIGCSNCPDGHSEPISWRGGILSSANINYDREWLELQNMWVKAGNIYMSSLGGCLRNDRWEVEGDELANSRKNTSSKLKDNIVSQRKTLGDGSVERHFSAPYWWSHLSAYHTWPALLRLRGEIVISKHRGPLSYRGQGKDFCPMCLCVLRGRVWKSKVRWRDKGISEEITVEELE